MPNMSNRNASEKGQHIVKEKGKREIPERGIKTEDLEIDWDIGAYYRVCGFWKYVAKQMSSVFNMPEMSHLSY